MPGINNFADNKYFIYLGPANQQFAGRLPDSRATPFSSAPGFNLAYSRTIAGTPHNPWAATWTYGPTGPYYYPTRVDVIPHLLPDIHPWWVFLPLASPSLCLWQHCLGPFNYNYSLFANPTADVVHAPGAGRGLAPAYEWIDDFTAAGSFPVTMTAFGPWGPGPASINQFTAWCVGTDAAASFFFDTLPITGSLALPNVGLRFSAEFATTSLFGSLDTNLQTMHVFVQ